jgi:hypothetical protein
VREIHEIELAGRDLLVVKANGVELNLAIPTDGRSGIEIRGGFPRSLSIHPEVSNVVRITYRSRDDV